MLFKKKVLSLLAPCTIISASTFCFGQGGESAPAFIKPNSDTEEDFFALNTSDRFLKIGGFEKQFTELLKEFAKTSSGAKAFGEQLVQHLIVNFIDSYQKDKQSHTKDTLTAKLRNLRSSFEASSFSEKEKKEKLFLFAGDEDRYKQHNTRSKIKESFSEVLVNILDNLNLDSEVLKNSNDADEFNKLLSNFWNYVLNDYLIIERPIPIQKLTWKYDTGNRDFDIAELTKDKNITLSDLKKPSYYFPFVSESSKSKFESFKNAFKTNSLNSNLEKYSDVEEAEQIINVTDLPYTENSSQFTIAFLELYRHSITNKRNTQQGKQFTNVYGETEKTEINKFFEYEKHKRDVVYFLLDKGNPTNKQRWIFYKDKEGIHAISVKDEFLNSYNKKKIIKEHLKNPKYDLKKRLSKHLEKHIDRLLLWYWDNFFENKENKWKKTANALSKFLLRDHYSKNLVDLRKKLISDYEKVFLQTLIRDGNNLKNDDLWEFAGRFPYDYSIKSKDSEKNKERVKRVFPKLESSYLMSLGDESVSTQLLKLFNTKEALDDYSSKIDELFKQQQQQQINPEQNNWKEYKFFNFNKSSEGSQENDTKDIKYSDLLNSFWLSLLENKQLVSFLLQEKIKEKSTFDEKTWSWEDSKVSLIDNQSLFKDKDKKNLVKNYLFSLQNEIIDNISSTHTKIEKLDEEGKLKELLQNAVKDQKINFSSEGLDIQSGGISLDLFTVKWLASNKFENFRRHLRGKLKRGSLSAFVFSRKFSEADKCLPTTEDSTELVKNLEFSKDSLKNSLLGATFYRKDKWNCPNGKDNYNFASVNVDSGEAKLLTGYKGLISGDWKKHFPEDIAEQLEYRNPLWTDFNSLINYIDTGIHGDKEYDELIKALKSLFPDKNWDISNVSKCQRSSFDWRSGSSNSSCLSKDDNSVANKKKLLKAYLNQESGLDKNASLLNYSRTGSGKLLKDNDFKTNHDWFQDKAGNILIQSKDGSQYQIYLIQIKYDDVDNQDSWVKYLETINSDYFLREVVKAARDPMVQKRALFGDLDSEKGTVKSFETGDDRLRKALSYSWLKSSQS